MVLFVLATLLLLLLCHTLAWSGDTATFMCSASPQNAHAHAYSSSSQFRAPSPGPKQGKRRAPRERSHMECARRGPCVAAPMRKGGISRPLAATDRLRLALARALTLRSPGRRGVVGCSGDGVGGAWGWWRSSPRLGHVARVAEARSRQSALRLSTLSSCVKAWPSRSAGE